MIKDLITRYKNYLLTGIVFLLIYFVYFHQLGAPALLDSDETRYADMARSMLHSKDFITLYLDDKIFWDKPPLFFWILDIFYILFSKITFVTQEFVVRIPSVMAALSVVAVLYFYTKKVISKRFAIVSGLILVTSVEFAIFSHVSILDMLLTANIAISTLCGLMTYFVKEENKKYFWWMFYAFSAFGILTKGIPAVVVPFGTMFFVGLKYKNIKEFFKPQYFVVGSLIFLLIALPWHIIMYHVHGNEFIKEYIIKHHFQRFLGSNEIGREHTLIYYIPTFIIGFLPWSMSFILGLKKLVQENKDKFVMMNLIGFVFTLVFFSVSKTKLITYILPLYPFAAVLTSYIWLKCDKEVKYSVFITNSIFIVFSILLACAGLYLPQEIYSSIKIAQIPLVIAFFVIGVYGLINNKKKWNVFGSYLILIAFLGGFMMPKLFNIWYSYGQNDLMNFAKYAKEKQLPLGAYNVWERFSLQYYYDGNVEYFQDGDSYGAKYVSTTPFKNTFNKSYVVVENNDLENLNKTMKLETVLTGKRYSLVKEH